MFEGGKNETLENTKSIPPVHEEEKEREWFTVTTEKEQPTLQRDLEWSGA